MFVACGTPTQPPPMATATPPDYKNATYMIEGQFVTLVNGFFEAESAPDSATKITPPAILATKPSVISTATAKRMSPFC